MTIEISQSDALFIQASEDRLAGASPEDPWDVSAIAGEWAQMAKGLEKQSLVVALMVHDCPRSQRLAEQYQDFWEIIANDAYVVQLVGGRLEGKHFSSLKVGDIAFHFPLLPAQLLFAVGDTRALSFRALALGPFEGDYTQDVMLKFLDGQSQWIVPAAGATVHLRRGAVDISLDTSNAFHCAVTANLPDEEDEEDEDEDEER